MKYDFLNENMEDISLVNDLMSVYGVWKDAKLFPNRYKITRNMENFLKLPCFNANSIKDINKCTSKVIVINNITESVHNLWAFRKYDPSKHYIIFSGGDWDKEKLDVGIPSYDVLYLPWWLLDDAQNNLSLGSLFFFLNKQYNFDYPKDYIFCSATGAKRELRTKLVEQLLENITYENYILKYTGIDRKCASDHLDHDYIKNDKAVERWVIDDGLKFCPHPDLDDEYNYHIGSSLPMDMYNAAYFNIIVETDLDYQHSFFVTEKTSKFLLCGMPFVIFSTPFFLKNLQNMGFRTYNTLWNEEYDTIENTDDRINKIVELVQTLEHFDWQENKLKLQEIFRHNLDVMSNRNILYDEFFKNLEQTIIKYNEKYNV